MIPDIGSPPWFLLGVFVTVALGLMVWFPIYYWLRDRARRLGYSRPISQTRNRRASALCGTLVLATLICAFWAAQQSYLELNNPSPLLLVVLAIICLGGSVASLAWAIHLRRQEARDSHDAA